MNNKKKPFNEVGVRQAINLAIPRDDIVEKFNKLSRSALAQPICASK